MAHLRLLLPWEDYFLILFDIGHLEAKLWLR
jgi:hypothetical protein